MLCLVLFWFFVFLKQKTAYDMRISDWSSYVCSSDLLSNSLVKSGCPCVMPSTRRPASPSLAPLQSVHKPLPPRSILVPGLSTRSMQARSEEHTSELQSLMRISYAVFCLKTKIQQLTINTTVNHHTSSMQIHHTSPYYIIMSIDNN